MLWNRVNTTLLVLVLLTVIGGFATRAWGGPLDPPAAPGPTQPQVEPRSPIPPVAWNGTFPITISQPGSYFLTRNLTNGTSSDGIVINTVADDAQSERLYSPWLRYGEWCDRVVVRRRWHPCTERRGGFVGHRA